MGLPNVGPLELIIILAIALLIVGPGRLPEMGNAIGRTIREFRKASSDITDVAKVEPETKPVTQVQPNTLSTEVAPNTTSQPVQGDEKPSSATSQAAPAEVAPEAKADGNDES